MRAPRAAISRGCRKDIRLRRQQRQRDAIAPAAPDERTMAKAAAEGLVSTRRRC
jgi:hypothetical protein